MQFLAGVGFLVLMLSQQGVSLQQREFVVGAAGNLGVAGAWPLSPIGNDHATPKKPKTAKWSGGIDFGGTHHGQQDPTLRQSYKGVGGDALRPELVRTQVCDDDSKCVVCTQETACWQGSAKGHARASRKNMKHHDGKLQLEVPANSAYNRFAAEVWASCANGEGEWSVHVWPGGLKNGFLNIFVDGKLHASVRERDEGKDGRKVDVPVEKDSRVRVEFIRTNTSASASGLITLAAEDVDERVDECMGVKYCLNMLGNETASLFRNSNVQQWRCLTANTTYERNNISLYCDEWDRCVAKDPARKKKLRLLLEVGIGTRGSSNVSESTNVSESLTEKKAMNGGRGRKSTKRCMDPATEDAESFDCECSAEVSEKCADGDEDCVRKFLCDSSRVCDSWKGENCESSLMAKQDASAVARREVGEDGIEGARLDSALEGKCTG